MPPLPLLALLLSAAAARALVSTISNMEIRRDVSGSIVNSHSGGIYRFGDAFYLYGTAYQNCTQEGPVCKTDCGYYNNRFVVCVRLLALHANGSRV